MQAIHCRKEGITKRYTPKKDTRTKEELAKSIIERLIRLGYISISNESKAGLDNIIAAAGASSEQG